MMHGDEFSDEEILYIVGTTDRELFDAGMDIREREYQVPRQAMKKLGYVSFVMTSAGESGIEQRVWKAFKSIYHPQDLAMGGHIGVFMYRDIFARIGVPHVLGRVAIHPFRFIELTPVQLRIIQTEPEQMAMAIDQFSDVFDIQYGCDMLKAPASKIELVRRYIGLARLHLHSAAAVLTGGYDFRGAVQSALLATELALKSGAAFHGLDEEGIRKRFNHKVADIADFVGAGWPAFDLARVKRVVAAQPAYVPNRYAATQPERREVGHLVMGAQFLVAEVVRQISDQNFRGALTPPSPRQYPA